VMRDYPAQIEPFYCLEWSYEGDDMVCHKHGFMWEGHRAFCNAISDEMIALITYAGEAYMALNDIRSAVNRHTIVTGE